ncbi:MAG: prepilin-type N-terminal cleavage/methylation domain-containing protein [Kiritimatiellae bacterium]|nr:prepilin-type N-terminal cleavage/methylation domain-containing protein [Kiritimatiellia bacterium]
MNKERGFTLIEVALSILVVAIGLLSLFSLVTESLSSGTSSKQESEIALMGNAIMNDAVVFISTDWANRSNYKYYDPNGNFTIDIQSNTNDMTNIIDPVKNTVTARINLALLPVGDPPTPEILMADACILQAIVFPGEFGDTRRYVFSTFLTDYGAK